MFRDLEQIKNTRRDGTPLSKILEKILLSEHLLKSYQNQLYRLLQDAGLQLQSEDDLLDFTLPLWEKLSTPQQIQYASDYQKWYASCLNQPVEQEMSWKDFQIHLALIPPGRFWMGSPIEEQGRDLDEERHLVEIRTPFWMATCPITLEQWETGMKADKDFFIDSRLPIKNISWNDCQTFIENIRGLSLQLPTEAQWEYACRAGTTSAYSFGDEETLLYQYGWYLRNSSREPQPVGQKKANAFGLKDMHGNVLEWCADTYEEVLLGIEPDPCVENESHFRVIRGGSFANHPSRCRSAKRFRYEESARNTYLGVRVISPIHP